MEQQLFDEVRFHFNQPILVGFRLGRLIGYGEDLSDCYMIVLHSGGLIEYQTMVGGYVYLDDHLPEWELEGLDTILELNGAPKQASFRLQIN